MKVGILGGGQLGQMTALAGIPLGLSFRSLDPTPNSCASQVCEQTPGAFEDASTLDAFVEGLAAVTYEWENVPLATAKAVAARVPVFFPSPEALAMAQDRLLQKNALQRLGIPTAPYAAVNTKTELSEAISRLGCPAILKTCRDGYDGKGQYRLNAPQDVDAAWSALGGKALVLEGFVNFDREVSLISVRAQDGQVAFYPLAQNEHRDGILRVSIAPAPGLRPELQKQAEEIAAKVLHSLLYVGVLSIEFFEVGGKLLVNELATRVHNSGHWTMDGAMTSQFENHLRAGLGLGLGSTAVHTAMAMVNLIGTVPESIANLSSGLARVHLYGKQPRPGRKLGHVNVPVGELGTVVAALGMSL